MINDILSKIRALKKVDEVKLKGEGNFEINAIFDKINSLLSIGDSPTPNFWGNAGFGEGKYEVYHEVRYFGGKRYDKSILIFVIPLGTLKYFSKPIKVFVILQISIADYDEKAKKGKMAIQMEIYTNYTKAEVPEVPLIKSLFKGKYEEYYNQHYDQIKKMLKKILIQGFLSEVIKAFGLNFSYG